MSSQIVPIHRTNTDSTSNKNDIWFNPFDFASGQDENIRWLSRPNQQLLKEKYSHDAEKFRITFDVENFQPEQIKIYIQNRKLTISGVYEERSEGRFMQKQFEKTFDIPSNADVDSMASFITAAHMLVVEIPLNASAHIDHLKINSDANNQRRQSFSLTKFNTSNNQGSTSSTSNDISNLAAPGQQVRRTSITKTTTTTTTSTGSSAISPEAAQLLKSADTTTGSHTHSSQTTEHQTSNTGSQQIAVHEPNKSSSSTTSSKQTTLTSSNLENLPIEIPPELLAAGGTITIQKRKVSVTKGTDGNADHSGSVPITRNDNSNSTSSTTITNTTGSNTTGSNTTNNTGSNTLNQQQSNTSERHGSKTISSSNQSRMYTLEEFLQNKTWNPSLTDGSDGKKILHMRLQMKPGTTLNQMKITLNGHDLRVEVDNKGSADGGRYMNEHSYRQVTLFPTCEVEQLKTELKDDGFLHIQVPIKL